MNFERKSPCQNCPYRKDAPLRLWDKCEFQALLRNEDNVLFGKVYQCHKKDGHVCVGWLMMQVKDKEPNINLRILFSTKNVPIAYRDSLFCKAPMYENVKDMILANYPELIYNES
jgi:hypothetical protein